MIFLFFVPNIRIYFVVQINAYDHFFCYILHINIPLEGMAQRWGRGDKANKTYEVCMRERNHKMN